MARPDRWRQRRRLPLLLATLAVVAAVAGYQIARPRLAAGQEKMPRADGATPADAPATPPGKTPAAKAPSGYPSEVENPPSLEIEWKLTGWVPTNRKIPNPPLGGPGGPIAAPPDAPAPKPREIKWDGGPNTPFPMPPNMLGVDLMKQTQAEADAKSRACIVCHQGVRDMHYKATVKLGCVDCHGGDCNKEYPPPGSTRYCPAAPPSANPEVWATSANPVRGWTVLNHENPDFLRFINPGDFRVAHVSCGTTNCHPKEVMQNHKSMMTHGCMLWEAAAYNNGGLPNKRSRFGEGYATNGAPLRLQTMPPPSEWEMRYRGVVPFMDPLPRFESSQPGNVLRIFERGGKFRPEVGIPERAETPGRPILTRLSERGLGTQNRTDPVMIGLQKTRLLGPTLNFMGTNDHPGDYRNSGCTGCHVVYANDRSPIHSGPYAKYGHQGRSFSRDPMIPKDEPGHPIEHRFAKGNGIPTSQCIICHMHPGTTVVQSYIGYMWWDLESDGEMMYPPEGKKLTAQEVVNRAMFDPNEASLRGNWNELPFLERLYDMNPQTQHNFFSDFHGHGWVYRAVFKQDRKGRILDYFNNPIGDFNAANRIIGVNMPVEIRELYRNYLKKSPEQRAAEEKKLVAKRHGIAHHLLDIHMEKGMHCVDCHFSQDEHGNGRLQMEVRAGIEIQCIDCHGSVTKATNLRTSGPAAYTSTPGKPHLGRDLTTLRTAWGKPRFEWRGAKLYQNSMVEKDMTWPVIQTKDTINPNKEEYNPRAALAKTVHWEKDKLVWGNLPSTKHAGIADSGCAHSNASMTCQSCHSSWNPSCFGCHLPQRANIKMPFLHWSGEVTRNYTAYNWQTLRDDVFMLARDGDATGNRINPSRSSCAVHVSSFNNLREQIYTQQQTISAEGWSGMSFSTNVPHTVGGKDATKLCTDCHLSKDNDNNAIMAQLLMQGTGYTNWMGRLCWVAAGEHGLFAPVVTELREPQTVIGSNMHKLAWPEEYEKHVHNDGYLKDYREHPGRDILENVTKAFCKPNVLALQNRGEYLYAACGEFGMKVLDISFVEHKGFAEKIFTAPVSPLGQRFYIDTKYATYVAAPTTMAPDPTRAHFKENREGSVPLLFAFLYVCDKYEGLILVGAGTLLDGNPLNNYLRRELTFNPCGLLCGAKHIAFAGNYGYVSCDAGVVVIDFVNPVKPVVKAVIGKKYLDKPTCVAFQFRYAYISDEEGVKVFDVTELDNPKPVSKIDVPHVHNIYLARTYAYLAAGKMGLVILDIENPEEPKVDQIFNADGCINDLHDVKLAITYPSEFAYLADGKNGMRVVQLTSPETPGFMGFSPRPTPKLIATFKIPNEGHAVAIARALDRDRAVDESGNQLGVFGRVGARPFNLAEQQKLYLHNKKVWKVSNDPNDPVYTKARWVEPKPARKEPGGPKLPPK
jgi:LVIVD repeat